MSVLFIVEQVDERGQVVCDSQAWLVLARTPLHAEKLVIANGDDLEGDAVALRAEPPEWTRGGEPHMPLVSKDTIPYGIWRPSDTVMAAYGFVPDDDWAYCGGCGIVRLTEEEWTKGGDECDECLRDATP